MTWALALSGGTAYGIANAGIVEILDQEGLRPDVIAGSSMGAIIAGLYALKKDTSILRDLCETLRLTNIAEFTPHALEHGLHSGLLRQRLAKHLGPIIGDATIGDCRIPFVCLAARVKEPIAWHRIIRKSFVEHISSRVEAAVLPPQTKLLDAFLATSAIPVLFSPMEIDGHTYVDLCNFGAIPSRTLHSLHHPDIVIGTDTAPRHGNIAPFLPAAWREFLTAANSSLEESIAACDLVIRPEFSAGSWRFDKAMEFFEAGKMAAAKKLIDIRSLFDNAPIKDSPRS